MLLGRDSQPVRIRYCLILALFRSFRNLFAPLVITLAGSVYRALAADGIFSHFLLADRLQKRSAIRHRGVGDGLAVLHRLRLVLPLQVAKFFGVSAGPLFQYTPSKNCLCLDENITEDETEINCHLSI